MKRVTPPVTTEPPSKSVCSDDATSSTATEDNTDLAPFPYPEFHREHEQYYEVLETDSDGESLFVRVRV